MTLARLFVTSLPAWFWPRAATTAAMPSTSAGQLPKFRPATAAVQAVDDEYFHFYSKNARWRILDHGINLVEYGQKVDRRYIAAVLISPLFLLAKTGALLDGRLFRRRRSPASHSIQSQQG